MTHVLQHRHLVVSALINKPPTVNDISFMNEWFIELVQAINMKILSGPHIVYSTVVGNKGLTGYCIIETSHITMHCWDEISPGKMELDVYTCSPLDISIIFDKIKAFDPIDISYVYLNRDKGINIIK